MNLLLRLTRRIARYFESEKVAEGALTRIPFGERRVFPVLSTAGAQESLHLLFASQHLSNVAVLIGDFLLSLSGQQLHIRR